MVVQVFDGEGIPQPGAEVVAEKPDPLIFEKRVICLLELMAHDLRDLYQSIRDSSGGMPNSFIAVDQLLSRLKSLSCDHGQCYGELIKKLKADIGMTDTYNRIELKDNPYIPSSGPLF